MDHKYISKNYQFEKNKILGEKYLNEYIQRPLNKDSIRTIIHIIKNKGMCPEKMCLHCPIGEVKGSCVHGKNNRLWFARELFRRKII